MHEIYSNFNQGDIVVIEFPFTNAEQTKLRPALVISNQKLHSKKQDVIICKVTGSYFKTQFEIELDKDSIEEGELIKKSWVDIGVIQTVEKKMIKRKIAKINIKKLQEVRDKLRELFD